MKRVFSLILVALVTFGVIYFIKYPELLEDIWLWLVGLSGSVVALGRRILDFFKEKLGGVKPLEKVVAKVAPKPFSLRLARFADDGRETQGILYAQGERIGFTLEASGLVDGKQSTGRIPAGTYSLIFNPTPNEADQRLKAEFPDWFSSRLMIKVPDQPGSFLSGISGDLNQPGMVSISDAKHASDVGLADQEQGAKFKELYKEVAQTLSMGKKVQISITDSE